MINKKKDLENYIASGDDQFLNILHETATKYLYQKELDKMIEEGEEDIAAGRVHSMDEVRKMIFKWTD